MIHVQEAAISLKSDTATFALSLTIYHKFSTKLKINTTKGMRTYALASAYISQLIRGLEDPDMRKTLLMKEYIDIKENNLKNAMNKIILTLNGKLNRNTVIDYIVKSYYDGDIEDVRSISLIAILALMSGRYFSFNKSDLSLLCMKLHSLLIDSSYDQILSNKYLLDLYSNIHGVIELLKDSAPFRTIISLFTHHTSHIYKVPVTDRTEDDDISIVSRDNFEFVKKLSSYVNTVKSLKTGVLYAEKSRTIDRFILTELSILTLLDSIYVIKLESFSLSNDTIYLYMEHASDVLSNYINKDDDRFWYDIYINGTCESVSSIKDKDMRYNIYSQLADGVSYLHDNGIIHRDIKPENILIVDGYIKITDFGLSLMNVLTINDKIPRDVVGTPTYMPIELLISWKLYRDDDIELVTTYSYDFDIWSLGVTICEIELGVRPFASIKQSMRNYEGPSKIDEELLIWCMLRILGFPKNNEYTDRMISKYNFSRAPHKLDAIKNISLRKMILSMLSYDPRDRPSSEEISVFFSKLH